MLTLVAKLATIPVVVLLVSCSSPAQTSSPAPIPAPSTAAPATTTDAPKKVTTSQGFMPKKLGELGGWDCTTDIDSCAIKFAIDKIDVNPKCDQYGTPAAAGRKILVLHVSLTTGNLSTDGAMLAPTIFNPFTLKGLGADGFVHDAQPGSCTSYDSRLSDTILPNSRYDGTVEVEVPESSTSIASAHQPGQNGERGWVWNIG